MRRCRKAEPDIADQAQMSPIGSRPRSPYPTARDQHAQKAAATVLERYGIYRAPGKLSKNSSDVPIVRDRFRASPCSLSPGSLMSSVIFVLELSGRAKIRKFQVSHSYHAWIPKTRLVSLYRAHTHDSQFTHRRAKRVFDNCASVRRQRDNGSQAVYG